MRRRRPYVAKGVSAAAWFAGQSFHHHPAPPAPAKEDSGEILVTFEDPGDPARTQVIGAEQLRALIYETLPVLGKTNKGDSK